MADVCDPFAINRENLLIEAANSVLEKWKAYSDETVSIRAFQQMVHHTIRLRQLHEEGQLL